VEQRPCHVPEAGGDHRSEPGPPIGTLSCSVAPLNSPVHQSTEEHESLLLSARPQVAESQNGTSSPCMSLLDSGVSKQDWQHMNDLLVANGFQALELDHEHVGYVLPAFPTTQSI
jgi:hypothetical protein